MSGHVRRRGLLALAVGLLPGAVLPQNALAIYGGNEVSTCAWPTAVSMQNNCTGTLVHPSLVVYAAHCGDGYRSVGLGESGKNPRRSVEVDYCEIHPQAGEVFGRDVAFCRLSEPVDDVPLVPILMGCEVEAALRPGKAITLVGFGEIEDGTSRVKHEVTTTHNNIRSDEADIGGDGRGVCSGDSGGPVFVRLADEDGLPGRADDSWRVYGVMSYVAAAVGCGRRAFVSMMHVNIEWLESSSGLDLSPCHDADGTWRSGPDCGGFPTDPGSSNGTWPSCAGGSAAGASITCEALNDGGSLSVSLELSPPGGEARSTFRADSTSGAADIEATVLVLTGQGSSVASVSLVLDGEAVASDESGATTCAFTLSLEPGSYAVQAAASDEAGNRGRSTELQIRVLPPTRDEEADEEVSAPSWGCTTSGGTDGGASLLGLWVGLLAVRRGRGPRRQP